MSNGFAEEDAGKARVLLCDLGEAPFRASGGALTGIPARVSPACT